ncbi:MAG: hypothetical protein JWM76_800 [Pseudonocardiales bacterium]|nr:hypothetical protein [Pseudonocardiales bacterium]
MTGKSRVRWGVPTHPEMSGARGDRGVIVGQRAGPTGSHWSNVCSDRNHRVSGEVGDRTRGSARHQIRLSRRTGTGVQNPGRPPHRKDPPPRRRLPQLRRLPTTHPARRPPLTTYRSRPTTLSSKSPFDSQHVPAHVSRYWRRAATRCEITLYRGPRPRHEQPSPSSAGKFLHAFEVDSRSPTNWASPLLPTP